jgi:hypothetical protein
MLIYKSKLKQLLLDQSKEQRLGRFTRVSEEVYPKAEAVLRKWAKEYVHRLPSVGKTIK